MSMPLSLVHRTPSLTLTPPHLHVLHRVHSHARHSYISLCQGIVRVIPSVGRKVKGHAESLLTGFDVGFVELVGLFHCTVASILEGGDTLMWLCIYILYVYMVHTHVFFFFLSLSLFTSFYLPPPSLLTYSHPLPPFFPPSLVSTISPAHTLPV